MSATSSQFGFLRPGFAPIAEPAVRAEAQALTDPRAACFYARRTLELVVDYLYERDGAFQRPYEAHLASLLTAPCFAANVPAPIVAKARIIKDLGNAAVHGRRPVRQFDSIAAVRELFHVCYWFARTYSPEWRHEGATFDPALLTPPVPSEPAGGTPTPPAPIIKPEELKRLAEELAARDAELRASRERQERTDAEITALRVEIAAAKARAARVVDDHDYSEAQTRDYFIDLMLREAGWGVGGWKAGEDTEYPVTGMPNEAGEGFVDYVLWGEDGKPLALVEAKRTKRDPRIGQKQAELYADCLEKKFKRRPVIYYSNGYETWIWDDHFYPPRGIQGFHTRDELELLITRRATRIDPAVEKVNRAIVERAYQMEAIREMGQRLSGGHRKGLLVMATGSGKTRTVIALVDLLMRCNWAKRVLFLADRTALVEQAHGEFKKHLPGCSPVNLVTNKHDTGRVYLSTYPTMLNLIEGARGGEGGVERRFGPGHFDIVVIDEAHRSVYQKYRAIFEYFDSLLIGLTATPRDEVDRDTYGLFDLSPGVPTFAYELETAVADGYLVPPKAVSVPLKFQRSGIRYDDLSEEDKTRWDALEWDEDGNVPDEVNAEAVNKWLFNVDTVDKVLEQLMRDGLKVAGGDRLGKTIIFAKNKDHARFIEERFNTHYPEHRGAFARVIDHYEPYAAALLKQFKIADRPPHIAISVDMLDTGIDVPECVNLVFFKLVRSKTKFWQMIGRGTRLCKDLFGPGRDKEFFYLFDYCQNLEYFSQNPDGADGEAPKSLSALVFLHRLDLHKDTVEPAKKNSGIAELRGEVADEMHREVAAMNVENFLVRPKRRMVERFRERKAWEELSPDDYSHVGDDLAGLPTQLEPEDESAKRFDLLLLRTQLAVLNHEPRYDRLREQVIEIAGALSEKRDIPMVASQMSLILDLQTDDWWQNATLPMLESVRKRLRDLVKFIDKSKRQIVYSDFEDEIGPGTEVDVGGLGAVIDTAEYRRKMLSFMREHENHIAIQRLRMNEPLTPSDVAELERLLYESSALGTKEDFERAFGAQRGLGEFIRSIVGLDRGTAQGLFAEFLDGSRFSAEQIRFVQQIIEHLTRNGAMDPALLYEAPYTDAAPSGVDGVFGDEHANQIIGLIQHVNQNARVRGSA